MDQIISTGDAATDHEIVEEMRRSYAAAGMACDVQPNPGGGYRVHVQMPGETAAAASVAAPVLPAGSAELGGDRGTQLRSAAQQGQWHAVVQTLQQIRSTGDWDEYSFMVEHVGESCDRSAIDRAVEQAPQVAELKLLRAAKAIHEAWEARGGGGTADTITEGAAQTMAAAVGRRDPRHRFGRADRSLQSHAPIRSWSKWRRCTRT